MEVGSWVFGAQPPSVTGASKLNGNAYPCSGFSNSVSVAITGTGFTNASVVYFVLETAGVANTSTTYSVDSFKVVSSTTIDACTPTSASGLGTAYTVVMTPTGASAYGSANIYSSL
jgi:hypothetical protein